MAAHRPIPLGLIGGVDAAVGDLPPLSPNAVRRVMREAINTLCAIEGLAQVAELPAERAGALLAEPAARLRRELAAAGVPLPAALVRR